MKRITINAYQTGLVFKKGVYQRLLKEGAYWFWRNEKIWAYEMNKPFISPIELNILLQDARLAEALHVVDVKDHEFALQYENGLLNRVLTAGRYTYWKGMVQYDFIHVDISKIEITEKISRATLLSAPVASYVRMYSVESYERAVLFIDGKFDRILDSGVYYWWKNNIAILVGTVDIRLQQTEINGQEILTRGFTDQCVGPV